MRPLCSLVDFLRATHECSVLGKLGLPRVPELRFYYVKRCLMRESRGMWGVVQGLQQKIHIINLRKGAYNHSDNPTPHLAMLVSAMLTDTGSSITLDLICNLFGEMSSGGIGMPRGKRGEEMLDVVCASFSLLMALLSGLATSFVPHLHLE